MNKVFLLRKSFSMAMAVFLAVVVSHHGVSHTSFWAPLATLFTMQTTLGLTLRSGLQRFLVLGLAVALGAFLVLLVHQQVIVDVCVIFIFLIACFFDARYFDRKRQLSMPMMVGVVALLFLLPFTEQHLAYDCLYDVALGALIGLMASLFVLPSRSDVLFRQSLVPVLETMSHYLQAITDLLFRQHYAQQNALVKKYELEKILQHSFPGWVYEAGFSSSLQEGYRHFLIKIEQMSQMLSTMHYIALSPIDPDLLASLTKPIRHCVDEARKLMTDIAMVLEKGVLQEVTSNMASEMATLESAFQAAIPLPLELLDLAEDNMDLAAFIYDLKDLQVALLKLVEALR